MRQKVYLSGPMEGCTYEEMTAWRETAARLLNSSTLKCISPARSFSPEVTPKETVKWINRRDYNDCVSAQCLLVNLKDLKRVPIGTIMEIAWAYQRQIPIVCIGNLDGIAQHPMLNDSITHLVNNLEHGVIAVKELLTEE